MSEPEQLAYYSLPPLMTPEDVKQENALRELEGLKPRAFRVSGVVYREIGFGLITPGHLDLAFEDRRAASYETVQKLMEWVYSQNEVIQELVFRYLDDPQDHTLNLIIKVIDRTDKPPEPKYKDSTLTALVLRCLPTTIEQLYAMARREHSAKRPEANIRQILRRMVRAGSVVIEGNTYKKAAGD